MLRLAILLVGRQEPAQDAVHDAFAKVYERWAKVDRHGAYLRTCVVNRCRDVQRRLRLERRRAAEARSTTPFDLEARELLERSRKLRSPATGRSGAALLRGPQRCRGGEGRWACPKERRNPSRVADSPSCEGWWSDDSDRTRRRRRPGGDASATQPHRCPCRRTASAASSNGCTTAAGAAPSERGCRRWPSSWCSPRVSSPPPGRRSRAPRSSPDHRRRRSRSSEASSPTPPRGSTGGRRVHSPGAARGAAPLRRPVRPRRPFLGPRVRRRPLTRPRTRTSLASCRRRPSPRTASRSPS